MAGNKNNHGGARKGSGSPGYGRMNKVLERVKKHLPDWWNNWEELMNSEDKGDKKYAMTEFNKLQAKMMPQNMEDDEGNKVQPVLVQIIRKPDDNSTENSNT